MPQGGCEKAQKVTKQNGEGVEVVSSYVLEHVDDYIVGNWYLRCTFWLFNIAMENGP